MQRFFDVLLSSVALLVFLPVFVPLALILRFTGEGKVFYLQERVGMGRRVFKVIKFATMLENSPNIGTGTVTVKDDPRVLPVGRFLRKSKLNELPQLLNILNGDMSVIGPRPQAKRGFDTLSLEAQIAITQIRPGLSGVGSIIFRDEESIIQNQKDPVHFHDYVIAPYKVKLEKWYIANQGLVIYFKLILLTIWVVIFPKSRSVWNLLPSLPLPESELATVLQ